MDEVVYHPSLLILDTLEDVELDEDEDSHNITIPISEPHRMDINI
jgi:hypothetical protein